MLTNPFKQGPRLLSSFSEGSSPSSFPLQPGKLNWGILPKPMAGETVRMSRLCQFTTTALLLVFCSISGALADDPLQFLYPDKEGLEFHYLDRIDVSYESNFSAPFLFTWCGQGNAQEAQQDRPDGGNATTQITLQFTSDGNLDCWFNLRIHDLGDSSPLGFNSPSFTYVYTTRKGGPVSPRPQMTASPRMTADLQMLPRRH